MAAVHGMINCCQSQSKLNSIHYVTRLHGLHLVQYASFCVISHPMSFFTLPAGCVSFPQHKTGIRQEDHAGAAVHFFLSNTGFRPGPNSQNVTSGLLSLCIIAFRDTCASVKPRVPQQCVSGAGPGSEWASRPRTNKQ